MDEHLGFLKAASACGSCGKDDELRFGTCFDCADKTKAKPVGDGLFRVTAGKKTYYAKTHGPTRKP
jgi:hypothetical protein